LSLPLIEGIAKVQFIDIPTEQTTAITDAVLALLALGCSFYLCRIRSYEPWKTKVWSWAFGLIAVSAVLGTIVHGFKISEVVKYVLWQPLFLMLGLAVSLFVVGVIYDLWNYTIAHRSLPIMLVAAVGFYILTRIFSGSFFIFIAYEALALIFALGSYLWLVKQGKLAGAALMASGILISIIAAIIQSSKAVSMKIIWGFDHNGIFHLLQMVGLLFLVAGLRSALVWPRMRLKEQQSANVGSEYDRNRK